MFNRDLLPSANSFYERELGQLGPTRRGWRQGRCLFHASKSGKSFSVNIGTGAFRCFGCGVHGGDMLAFVRLRDKCDFKTAYITLGVWRAVTPEERTEMVRRQQELEWNRVQKELKQQVERRERLQVRNELHTSLKLYREADAELHQRGAEADDYWSPLPPLLDDQRLTESAYCKLARIENPWSVQ
jgi:hypothetical protein